MHTIIELENEIDMKLGQIFEKHSYSRFTGSYRGDKKILGEHIDVVFYTWSVYNKRLGVDVEKIFKEHYCKILKLHSVKKEVINYVDQITIKLVFEGDE